MLHVFIFREKNEISLYFLLQGIGEAKTRNIIMESNNEEPITLAFKLRAIILRSNNGTNAKNEK
jgi:hypothetical protein